MMPASLGLMPPEKYRPNQKDLMRLELPISAFVVAACCCAGLAMAGELPGGKAGNKSNSGACAGYGQGFVPVAGSNTCVRVSGHVRMEYTWGKGPGANRSGSGSSSYAPAEPAPSLPEAGFVFGRLKPASADLPQLGRARGLGTGLNRIPLQ